MTRLRIWWHRKASGHHTLTYWKLTPPWVACTGCEKQWPLV